jgi:hypothetical protein
MKSIAMKSKRIAKLEVSQFGDAHLLPGFPEPSHRRGCVCVISVHCEKKTCVRKSYHLPPASFRSSEDSPALRFLSRDRSRATAAL